MFNTYLSSAFNNYHLLHSAAGIEEGDKKLMELKQQKFRVELLEKEVLLAEAEFHKISEEEKSLKKK